MSYLFTLALSVSLLHSFSSDQLWQKVVSKNLQVTGTRRIMPQQTSVVQLNDAAFKTFQSSIPTEESGKYILMQMPVPDGSVKEFKVFERTTMEQELADKYPMIKTYQAVSVEDASVTAKLDYTEFGFHAMVFDHGESYFIDPYTNNNTGYYNCYYKKYYTRANVQRAICETPNKPETTIDAAMRLAPGPGNSGSIVNDGKRRTFRLALACTIEYSKAVAGPTPTKSAVLSAIVTSINRVNGVYEREVSIHMNLVNKEDTLIFLTTDSYSNSNGGAMLGQNQTICDNRIGSANYDIGHVFSTGGGGIAGLGVVCSDGEKANGVTGSSDPVGDGFDIDYVVHEMGHQFGANHTFNGNTGSCGGNREASVAYEVGSGTTIMAYAGICDNNDTQLHSDDYFHRASINEIYNYISGTSCGVLTPATNTPPTVTDYAATYNVPYKTDFEISTTATSAHGNPVTYCWEEYDLGPAGNWNAANNTTAPIFRSFLANTTGERVFPRWDSLITNTIKYKGEILPEVARSVKFRCTVRDIENGYGVYNAPNTDLLVKAVVTPTLFRVTSQPVAATINGLTTKTISWDVANTTAAPVSCANVNIYLSLDSARSFPYVLAANVPNNGSAIVQIPDVVTSSASARIKVKGADNIFFDLNDGWLKINQAVIANFTASDSSVCEGGSITFTNATTGAPDSVRWTINGGTPVTSTSLTTVTSTFNTPGSYNIILAAYSGGVLSPLFFRTIEVKATPTISFTPAAPVVCAGDSLDITADYDSGATGIWSTGSTNTTITVKPAADTYYSISVTNNGCTATDSVLVKVNPSVTTNISDTICEGDSVKIGAQPFTTTGIFTVHLQSSTGCDSSVILDLLVHPKKVTNIASTVCQGESVTIGGQSFNIEGNYTVHFQSATGCDSAVNLTLTLNPVAITGLVYNICLGDSVSVGGQSFDSSGSYSMHFQTSLGCDSTVNLSLTVTPVPVTPVLSLRNDSLIITTPVSITANLNWFYDGAFLATTSKPGYLPLVAGSWSVIIVDNGCPSPMSDPFIITGLKSQKAEVQFSVSPNPNNGQFELKVTAFRSSNYSLMMYNAVGQEIIKEQLELQPGLNTKRFNIAHLEKGMYFISLAGEDGIHTQSLLIQ